MRIRQSGRGRDIVPGLKRTNMSLHTELGFTSEPDYKDVAPMALPEGLGWSAVGLTKTQADGLGWS
jgi:hypothetical protein